MATTKGTARPQRGAKAGGRVTRKRRLKRPRWLLWAAFLCAVPVLLALVSSTAAYVALRQGPIATDFLIGTLESAINKRSAPLVVKIGTANLRLDDEDGSPGFALTSVEVTGANGQPWAKIANATVGLDWMSVLTGSFEPTSVTLVEPLFRLNYAKTAGLQLRAEPDATTNTTASPSQTTVSPPVDGPALNPPALNPLVMLNTVIGQSHPARGPSPAAPMSLHIRNARMDIAGSGRTTPWRIPNFDFRLGTDTARNILVGSGNVVAPSGPFHVTVTAEQPEAGSDLLVSTSLDHIVPADFADLSAALAPLAPALLPVGGNATMAFAPDGALSRLDMNVGLGRGQLDVGGACADSFKLDQGGVHIRYVKGSGRIELLPSQVKSNGSGATVSGNATVNHDAAGQDRWQYNLQLADARIADPEHGLSPVAIDGWTARGTFTPSTGEAVLDRLALEAGDMRMAMAGRASSAGLEMEARVASAASDLVLRLWPACFQTYARNWVLTNVQSGQISKGHMRVSLDAEGLRRLRQTGKAPDDAATAEFEVDDIAFKYAPDLPPVIATHGKMQFSGSQFTAEIPDAASQMPSGRVLTLTDATYTVANFLDPSPRGKITLKAAGPIEAALEYLDAKPLGLIRASGIRLTDLSGEFSGKLDLELPVTRLPATGDIALKASATLTSLKLPRPISGFSLQGGTVDLEATEASLRADGDLLVNGVAAKLLWSRPLGEGSGPSPPVRITATLDANDREQLGILVNHMVSGVVPVTVDIATGPVSADGNLAHVEANLSEAELVLDTLAWRKPQGEAANVSFDVIASDKGKFRLDPFQLSGEKIAVKGSVDIGADNKLSAFHFPEFSINVVTRLDVTGTVRADKVLDVYARGSYFEGREFFKSLFSIGQIAAKPLPISKATSGLDLTADIDTILGFSQVALHDVHLHAERRQGLLTALEGKGTLDGKAPIGVRLERKAVNARYLRAQAEDAGQAFKLIGLYNSLEGGDASLEVSLDSQGGIDKTGTLWARRFTVLGDPVVNQVLTGTTPSGAEAAGNSDRQRFDFDRMRVRFSVGSGQLAINDMFINGPALGATLRGRIDYAGQSVHLGGTYVPLYGLNSMFGALPVIGQLLVGRNGEGLLGITFAVEGPLAKPEVIVNPVSAVAPGIFRQIFEIGPDAARIQPDARSALDRVKPRTSSLPPSTGSQANSTDIGDPFLTGGPDDSPWPDNGLPSTQQK